MARNRYGFSARETIHWRTKVMKSLTAIGLGALAFLGCIERPLQVEKPQDESGYQTVVNNEGVDTVDLLMMVDNSNSMRDNQTNIMNQLGPLIDTLVAPPCISASNSTPHTCNPMDPTDMQQYPPVKDLHVGIV